jgi:hypothetical protein
MLRKNIRERREYLYTLEQENALKKKSLSKQKILEAKDKKSIPT